MTKEECRMAVCLAGTEWYHARQAFVTATLDTARKEYIAEMSRLANAECALRDAVREDMMSKE